MSAALCDPVDEFVRRVARDRGFGVGLERDGLRQCRRHPAQRDEFAAAVNRATWTLS